MGANENSFAPDTANWTKTNAIINLLTAAADIIINME
jgi:hypothetical protein